MLSQSGLVVIAAWVLGSPEKKRPRKVLPAGGRDWTPIEVGSFTEQY